MDKDTLNQEGMETIDAWRHIRLFANLLVSYAP